MNIIVAGCGKVGGAIAEELVSENHDIVIVDTNAERLEHIGITLDVMCINGDAASVSVLEEAGADKCDLLIAITQSDEVNLLSCLIAKKWVLKTQLHAFAIIYIPMPYLLLKMIWALV